MLRGEDVRRGDDGETMADVARARRRGASTAPAEPPPAGACAVVSTHGAAARAVAAWLLGLEPRARLAGARRALGNCHWAELREGRAGWRIQTWNASSGVASRAGSPPP